VCVYAWSRLVNVSHNTTLRWVCVHGDVNWLIVECSLSQWLIMRVPWLGQCFLTADPLLCVPLSLYWVIEDVGVIDNLWLCESLIKIDHANPLVGKVKVAIWTCNSRTILLNWFVAKPPLGGRRFVCRGDVDWSMVMGLLQASHDWSWEYRIRV